MLTQFSCFTDRDSFEVLGALQCFAVLCSALRSRFVFYEFDALP